MKKAESAREADANDSLNEVLLRGRVSGQPLEKELPSGDHVVEFRIVIPRKSRDGVDTLDIAAWTSKARRTSLSLKTDEWVEISGAVRRRFWQAPSGLASRWQIEASAISRI
ncbi:MAG TPA: single-stranded DNA-binding protein [Candidatus Nanopelagicaceae bacterium]